MFTLGAKQQLQCSKPWKKWLKLITKGGTILEVQQAAIFPDNGTKATHSKGFIVTQEEITTIRQCFQETPPVEVIRAGGHTYCFKSVSSEQIIAFSGARYLIATRTGHLTIVAVCQSRDKMSAAAKWLLKIASHID